MFFNVIITGKSEPGAVFEGNPVTSKKDGKTTVGACLDFSGTEFYLKIL